MALTGAIALDCEMVGGPSGENMAARVTLVNEHNEVLLDKYIKPPRPVSDYRTSVSGIRAADLQGAEPLGTVKAQVANIINGRSLVGHSLDGDLSALGLQHPAGRRYDLALYQPFRNLNGGQPASLQLLSQKYLNRSIQTGPHSSLEDAKACMAVYKRVQNEWR